MGASAIRLLVAEIDQKRAIRTIEEASRGVLLGRDTFSNGAIRSDTVDAALEALEGFRRIMDTYGVTDVRAVATSAVSHPASSLTAGGGCPCLTLQYKVYC